MSFLVEKHVFRLPVSRVAGIYGIGRTIYTPFLKKCAAIYGLNMVSPLKKVTFLTHNTRVHNLIHQDLLRISVRHVEDVAKMSPPKQCPNLYGPTFHKIHVHFAIIRHQTQLVSKNKRPTEVGYKEYGLPKRHIAAIYGLTKGAKNRHMFTLTREKRWLEMIRPLVPKTQK